MNKKIIFTILLLFFCIKIQATEYSRILFLSNKAHSNLQFNKDLFFDTVNVGNNINNGTSPLTPLLTLDYALSELRDNVNIDTLIIIGGENYTFNANYVIAKTIISNWAIITTPKNSNDKYFQNTNINNIFFYDLYVVGSGVAGLGFFYQTILNNCIIDSSFIRRADGPGFFSSLTSFNNCVISNNYANHSDATLSTFTEIDNQNIKNSIFLNNYTNNSTRGFFYQRTGNAPASFNNNIIQNNSWSVGISMFGTAYNNAAETNIVYNNLNTTNLNTGKITEQINFTQVGSETYFQFNTNQTEYGLSDASIKDILLYRYSFMNDTLAALIISPKLKNNDNRAEVISNDVFSIDTKAAIIANDVFNNDTRIAIFFSINYNTATANLTMLSNYFTADSLTIASELLDLDTTVIIYPAQSEVYNDTNYFLLSWGNLKGAIGSWKVELATDAAFTADYDSIIIDVNTNETANTTQYYKQLNDKVWYMRVIPYSAKLE